MRGAAGRHLREWAILLALLLLLLAAGQRFNWLERADYWFYDSAIAWTGRPAPSDILIVAIDEASLAQVGRWPWSREHLALLVERLHAAGSGPVLLDVILAEPQRDNPKADARLAAALAAHGRVVLPVFQVNRAAQPILPLSQFLQVTQSGHAQALVDSDGVSRRYLSHEVMADRSVAHVSEVLAGLARMAGTVTTPGMAQTRLVPFAAPAGHFQRVSAAALLDGTVDAGRLRGTTVLIGATATGLGDNLVTPLAGVNGTMPGVEFVANCYDALRQGLRVQAVGTVWQAVGATVLLVGLMLVLLLASPRRALLASAGFLFSLPLLAWALLAWGGWWWAPALPMAAAALAYPLWSWRRLESSLHSMGHETARMAALTRPGGTAVWAGARYLDPVETRIAAISHAVDDIAQALTLDGGGADSRQLRENMMRHLAHDLRSPLVSLRAVADQLRQESGASQLAMLQRIDACAQRSLDLTEQFLLLGRAQALEPGAMAEIDLVQLLHQCADDLWEDAQRSGARIERHCVLDLALVRGDARLLQRAVLNLGWNALRHGPRGASVTLSLTAMDGGFEIAVHDEGGGFPAYALAGQVRGHEQGSRASAQSGYGLGLALVRLVAEKHQADLSASHPAAGGFSVMLRIAGLH